MYEYTLFGGPWDGDVHESSFTLKWIEHYSINGIYEIFDNFAIYVEKGRYGQCDTKC